MTLKDYRILDIKTLKTILKETEENRTYWLQSQHNYPNDSYNQNRCINEAIKQETKIKRINKVIQEKEVK